MSDLEICRAIADGIILGCWLDNQDVELAKTATDETAKEVIDKIDKNRSSSYAFYKMFD